MAAPNLSEVKLNITNENGVNFRNSGGKLDKLSVEGTGSIELGLIPKTVTFLDANQLENSIKFTLFENNLGASTETGDDNITIKGGLSTIETHGGNDTVTMLGGSNQVITGNGDDIVEIAGGSGLINTGAGNDLISLAADRTGLDTSVQIRAGAGNDTIFILDGVVQAELLELDGGIGTDRLAVVNATNIVVPRNLNFEVFSISNTVHQSLDLIASSFSDIELASRVHHR